MAKHFFSYAVASLLVMSFGVGVVSAQLPDTLDLSWKQEDIRVLGDDEDDYSGQAVATGDINGDGYDDLIIGAWAAHQHGRPSAGETYIIYGSAHPPNVVDVANGEQDVRILGDDEYDDSGRAVATGDINGDGYDDVIIGAWAADPPGGGNAGETYVIYGSAHLPDTVDLANGEEDVRILGGDDTDLSGFAVASGDVNGDGYDDVIIGAPWADQPVGLNAGETYVIYGSAHLPDTVDVANGEEDVRILGRGEYDDSGRAVSSGDINGDGYDDLIIGAPEANPRAGVTYVFYGSGSLPDTLDVANGEEDVCILGDDEDSRAGIAVASGDINGDGYDDLIIGASQANALAGETYVIYGAVDLSHVLDLANGEEDVRIVGDDEYDRAGIAVASGDINGDGRDDLVIGATAADPPGGGNAGETYLIYGSGSLPDTVDLASGEEDVRILGDSSGDRSGCAVASGDINGDGVADVVIGAWGADPPGGPGAGETYVIYGLSKTEREVSFFDTRVPEEYHLSNHPNPFNLRTVIEYALLEQVPVTLTVYNILGQEVKTVVDEQKGPGCYAVAWDGRDNGGLHVVSGVYFCRIEAGEYGATRKMVLLK